MCVLSNVKKAIVSHIFPQNKSYELWSTKVYAVLFTTSPSVSFSVHMFMHMCVYVYACSTSDPAFLFNNVQVFTALNIQTTPS